MTQLDEQILQVITRYAKQRGLKIPAEGLDLEKSLSEYGLESLDEVAIVSDIEDELDIDIDDDKIREVDTLAEFIEIIRAMTGPRLV